jgi:hypothetical protein
MLQPNASAKKVELSKWRKNLFAFAGVSINDGIALPPKDNESRRLAPDL